MDESENNILEGSPPLQQGSPLIVTDKKEDQHLSSPTQQFAVLQQFNQHYLGDDEEIDAFLEEQHNLYLKKKQSTISPQVSEFFY